MSRKNLLWSLCILALPNFAAAQGTWVDKVIIIKKPGIKIGRTGDDGKAIYLATLTEPDYVVRKELDGWLQVRTRQGAEGWFDKDDAVLLPDAAAYFTGVIKKNPADASAHFFRGVAAHLNNATDAALPDLSEAIRLDPKLVLAYVVRGRILTARADVAGAVKDLDEAIRLDPANKLGFLARGQAWQARKDHDKAIKDFDDALRLDPIEIEAFLGRGQCFDAKKDFDRAIKDFSEVIRLEPTNTEAYSHRAFAWNDKKEPDKAIKDFSEVIRLEPRNAEARCNRGAVWQAKKDFGRAFEDYNEAMKADPKSFLACNVCAWLLATCPEARFRDGKKAVELAAKAVELSGQKDPICFDTLAAAHAEAGNFDEAVRWQQRALADDNFAREFGEPARQRLEMYRNKKPYHE